MVKVWRGFSSDSCHELYGFLISAGHGADGRFVNQKYPPSMVVRFMVMNESHGIPIRKHNRVPWDFLEDGLDELPTKIVRLNSEKKTQFESQNIASKRNIYVSSNICPTNPIPCHEYAASKRPTFLVS